MQLGQIQANAFSTELWLAPHLLEQQALCLAVLLQGVRQQSPILPL